MVTTRALVLVLTLPVALAGCLTAASTAYKAATEERTVGEQADDAKLTAKIRKGIYDAADLKSLIALDVFCHRGRVVLAGVVPSGSPLGEKAAAVARGVEGVRSVETYFLPAQPSKLGDFKISTKLKARIIGDGDLKASQVDLAVIAGHVVLTGVVSRQDKIEQVVRHARAVEGVVAVKSFMQVLAE